MVILDFFGLNPIGKTLDVPDVGGICLYKGQDQEEADGAGGYVHISGSLSSSEMDVFRWFSPVSFESLLNLSTGFGYVSCV